MYYRPFELVRTTNDVFLFKKGQKKTVQKNVFLHTTTVQIYNMKLLIF
jgi:hypothetical protein